MLEKIVSGGQTGADRAALDVAILWPIAYGGWIPKGRLAENGKIPSIYTDLTESASDDYAVRTALNVADSDGTIIFSHGEIHGGTQFTLEQAITKNKPYIHIDFSTLNSTSYSSLINSVLSWIAINSIKKLNIAGPRSSDDPRIYDAVRLFLIGILQGASSSFDHDRDEITFAYTLYNEFSAKFRHWDTIRWLVPSWYATLIAGLFAIFISQGKPPTGSVYLLFALLSSFCFFLQLNLIRYHKNSYVKFCTAINKLQLPRHIKLILTEELPFHFSWPRIISTATFWLLITFGLLAVICFLFSIYSIFPSTPI